MGLSCDDLILDNMLRGDSVLGDSGVALSPSRSAEVGATKPKNRSYSLDKFGEHPDSVRANEFALGRRFDISGHHDNIYQLDRTMLVPSGAPLVQSFDAPG